MVVVYVILGLLTALVVYLLFAPFRLEINTTDGVLRARFHILARACVRNKNDTVFLEWCILGVRKDLDLRSAFPAKENAPPRRQQRKSSSIPFRKILSVVRSFKVNKVSLQFDTGDMALNGKLFPVFMGAGWLVRRDVRIIFNGNSELVLEIENNAFRLLRAYLFPN